jgi:TRAP-type C4-dicarboxylate transport system substrate-binding protein
MITSLATGTQTKSWEFVKNYYATNAFHPKNVVVVNGRAFNRLTAAQQKSLQAVAAAAEKRGWDLSKQREQSANKMLADNGMTVHTPDAALMAALGKIGDTIAAEWLKAAGADGEAILKAYRGK